MKKETPYAHLIIRGLPTMTEYRKSRLVEWLYQMATDLKKEAKGEKAKDFAKTYSCKLFN